MLKKNNLLNKIVDFNIFFDYIKNIFFNAQNLSGRAWRRRGLKGRKAKDG